MKFYKKLVVAIILIATALFFFNKKQKKIIIYNLKSGIVYLEQKIKEKDVIEYKWIHSLEKIPWKETFIVTKNNKLLLTNIEVAGFGAGIPENKGKLKKIEDGMIVYEEINETFENIQWINSNTALNYIKLNEEILIEGKELPHHEIIILQIQGGTFFE